MPDRTTRSDDGRLPLYELPAKYAPRPAAGNGHAAVDVDLDNGASVRAVHRDAVLTPEVAFESPVVPAVGPRSRKEFVEQRSRERSPWRAAQRTRSHPFEVGPARRRRSPSSSSWSPCTRTSSYLHGPGTDSLGGEDASSGSATTAATAS